MDVLHLFGSTREAFYADLSRMYASAVLRPDGTRHRFAEVAPDGSWRFGAAPDDMGPRRSLAEAVTAIGTPDLVVPHMFCPAGMTSFRALVEDILGLPLVGSPAAVTGLATSKLWTRDVVASSGVPVAAARRIAGDTPPDLDTPYVVKPDTEDNSRGISIVRSPDEAPDAIADARRFDDTIFAEAFVPGREIRAAVIDLGGELIVPSFIEYPLSDARPIREVADKLEGGGTAMRLSTRTDAQPICPAAVDDDLARALARAAKAAHRALGARHYSLFDFRVHAGTGVPILLEAGLFWSFSSLSAISKMLTGSGMDPARITGALWAEAAGGAA